MRCNSYHATLLQSQLSETDFSGAEAVSSVLKEQSELIGKNESLLIAQRDSLLEMEKSMSESADSVKKLSDRVDNLEEEVNKILALTGEMQVSRVCGMCVRVGIAQNARG